MLKEIYIRNLVTIEEQSLQFHPGCTMITGETGAGKSIFIEAIELALGARGTVQMIRGQKDQADIHLAYDISQQPRVLAWLKEEGLGEGEADCLIRRTLTRDGRSRSTINSVPVTLQQVRTLSQYLFDLHKQHAERSLLQSDRQREILDRYANCETLAMQVDRLSENWHTLAAEIASLQQHMTDKRLKEEALRAQLEELEALHLSAGEWEALEKEQRQLSHLSDILQRTKEAQLALVNEEEQHVMAYLKRAQQALKTIQPVESQATQWFDTLETARLSIADLADGLSHYLDTAELDPERLQKVENRISTLFHVARKYQTTPPQLLTFIASLSGELAQLETSDTTLKTLQEKQRHVALAYDESARRLSEQRKRAASELCQILTQTMRGLSLPHCEFRIVLDPAKESYFRYGLEKIIFMMKTNPDTECQVLSKILSGGELSRVSLAIHLALSHHMTIPTLIFDEIDVGVGGATAEKIGKLLQRLGETCQVFCITHQAQVASAGHQHLLVKKEIIDNQTFTCFKHLSQEERIHEMARLLGGQNTTAKAKAYAKEMLGSLE
jgi:DNA repair protein RecN (Recombination protein N)